MNATKEKKWVDNINQGLRNRRTKSYNEEEVFLGSIADPGKVSGGASLKNQDAHHPTNQEGTFDDKKAIRN